MIHGSKIVQRLWSSAKCVQFMSDSAVTVLYAWNEKSGWKIFQFSTSELCHLPYKQQGSSTTFEICGSIQLSQCLEGICTSTRTSCQAPARLTHLLVFTSRKNFKIDWLSSSATQYWLPYADSTQLSWFEELSKTQTENHDRLFFVDIWYKK